MTTRQATFTLAGGSALPVCSARSLVRVLVWPSSVIGKGFSEESASIILPIGLVGARGSFSKTVPQSVELVAVSHVPT